MDRLSDMSEYNELKRRIIRNDELSDDEWELFYKLDSELQESKLKKQTWDNLFLNSMLVPEQRNAAFKKHSPVKDFIAFIKPYFGAKFQYAYAGLIVFFFIGFLSYSALIRKPVNNSSFASVTPPQTNQKQEIKPIEKKSEVPEKNSDLLVYNENPYLEDYISDAVRSVTEMITLTSPQPSLRYQLKEETTAPTITFSGTMFSDNEPSGDVLLKIFSNNNTSYSEDQPIFKENIEFQKDSSALQFSKKVTYPLKKGLYYFTIEDANREDILYMNKFYIY